MAAAGALRRLRHSSLARRCLAALGAGYIRLILRTTRWQVEGGEHAEACLARRGGFICCLWHGRLFMSPTWVRPGRRSVAMISNNRDGDLIAAVVARFGVSTVRGSTYDKRKRRGKGGYEAFKGAETELLEHAAVVAITPDGPRGPRMRAQPGAATLSIATGAPILPVSFSTRRGIVLKSWDRFLLPLPFGRGALVYGPPLDPPAGGEATILPHRAAIERATTAVQHRADEIVGRAPVEPAAEPRGEDAETPAGPDVPGATRSEGGS